MTHNTREEIKEIRQTIKDTLELMGQASGWVDLGIERICYLYDHQLQKAREEERENINNWAQYTFAYQPSVLKEWEAMYYRMTHPDENPNHSDLDQDNQ